MSKGSQVALEEVFEDLNDRLGEWAADFDKEKSEAIAQVHSWAGSQMAESFKMWLDENWRPETS